MKALFKHQGREYAMEFNPEQVFWPNTDWSTSRIGATALDYKALVSRFIRPKIRVEYFRDLESCYQGEIDRETFLGNALKDKLFQLWIESKISFHIIWKLIQELKQWE